MPPRDFLRLVEIGLGIVALERVRIVRIGRLALEILLARLEPPVKRIVVARRIGLLVRRLVGLLLGLLLMIGLMLVSLILIGLRLMNTGSGAAGWAE